MRNKVNEGRSSPSTVREFFDCQAGRFPEIGVGSAGIGQRFLTAVLRRSLQLRFQRVFERIGSLDGRRVLDIGCGSGVYTVRAASAGAARAVGIDFSSEMIRLARERAKRENVSDRCEFLVVDFLEYQAGETFDIALAMGVMDYIADPIPFVTKVKQAASRTAFLSFPKSGGILAWQRKLRYQRRCPLFMYSRNDLEQLLGQIAPDRFEIESAARDWFVTIRGIPEY